MTSAIKSSLPVFQKPWNETRQYWMLLVLLVLAPRSALSQEIQSTWARQRQMLANQFERDMQALAIECRDLGHDRLSAATLDWIKPRDASRHYLFLPPSTYVAPGDPAQLETQNTAWPEWHRRLRELREKHAQDLYEFAQTAATQKQWHIAGSSLWESLWQNPEFADVRRILDYHGLESEIKKINIRVARKNETTLGWQAGSYREGTAGQFRLLTTADDSAARELLYQLQVWRILWRQACFPYWINTDGAAQAIKAGRIVTGSPEAKHTIVLFANRQEFLQALRRVPGIEQSVGYFDSETARCFFYLDSQDPNLLATQKHELVHQLFQETGKRVRQPGEDSNFWLLEAAAMYFESLERIESLPERRTSETPVGSGEIWSVGGFDAQRLQFARLRWKRENFMASFSTLFVRGRQDFQRDPELARLYSQAAGMFHFLMHTEFTTNDSIETQTTPGSNVDVVFRILTKMYAGRDRADLVESETGQTPAELEQAYKEWLAFNAERDSTFLPLASNKLELALGFSPLADDAMSHFQAPGLKTLQLTKTSITDESLQQLATHHRDLQELFLDQTQVSDRGVLDVIKANRNLEALDLANTKISDAAVIACRDLSNLEALWLTQTNVTDEVVPTLLALPKLRVLDVQGTKISPTGQQQLSSKFK
ncbi:MAG: hypothetical protein JNL67_14815 [Planctomycetaceae bacterium]|nr:hypothetical protein [Planctomycetaceae bacterium]